MRTLTVVLPILVLIAGLNGANADGMLVMKHSPTLDPKSHARDITEPLQKALIVYDKGVEHLILQVSYKGSASEFAWLVPTPSRPEVAKVDAPVFHTLHSMTAPRIRYWFDANKKIRGYYGPRMAAGAPGVGGLDVDVLQEEQVGIYDIAVLRAGDANDLVKWLRQNGYQITSKLAPVLSDYVRRGWVFTAMRIDTRDQERVTGRMNEGLLPSLRFTFKAPEPIYPLKVSSLNKGKTDILLYVAAVHRVDAQPMATECSLDYAVSGTQFLLETAGTDLPAWRSARLTKLTATLSAEQMTHDLVLKPASTDDLLLVKNISPPFLDNLGATSLLVLQSAMPYPQSLVVMGIAGLVALSPFGRRRWRLWIAAGIVFVIAGIIIADGMRHMPSPFMEERSYSSAGIWTIVLVGIMIACIVVFSLLDRRKRA